MTTARRHALRSRSALRRAAGIASRAWIAVVAVVVAGSAFLFWTRTVEEPKPCSPPAGPGTPEAAAPRTSGFEERAEAAGIKFRTSFLPEEQGERFKVNFYDHGAAVAVGDYDADGRDDVYFCNQLGPNALFHNLGGGQFEDVTAAAGPIALADRVSVSAAWGDYDNDGRVDLYVTTTRGGNALFHNEGAGRFEDVTEKAGVALVAHSQSATFFDADGDGFLDLLVSNTAKWTLEEFDKKARYWRGGPDIFQLIASPIETNRFYRNRHDGTFDEVAEASGLSGTGWSGDTAVFDFDEDGDLDVLVVNMFGASHLYENDGKGFFTEVTKKALGRVSWGAVGAKALDYDDDGHLDLMVVDMHSDMWMGPDYAPGAKDQQARYDSPAGPAGMSVKAPRFRELVDRLQIKKDDVIFGNSMFHARGDGRFDEVSAAAHVETFWPWSIAAADFDGDRFVDMFFASGMGSPFPFWPSPLLMNRGDGTFADRAKEAGLDPMPGGNLLPEKIGGKAATRGSRAGAVADFDGDGRPDLVVNNFNDKPLLLMNRWPKQAWVAFRLEGTRTNRDAIGAVVRLKIGGKTLTRQVDAAGGYLAQSSLALLFGLGDAKREDVTSCEVTWSGGKKQAVAEFELGKVNRVSEPR